MKEINHWSQIDTPMLQKLCEYLENTPREQIERDWAAVKAKGLAGPTVKEFIDNFKQKDRK